MKDWRGLAEQGSKETDPPNLMGVLEELDRVLDEERPPSLVLHRSNDASEVARVELAKRLPKIRKSLLPHFRKKLGDGGDINPRRSGTADIPIERHQNRGPWG